MENPVAGAIESAVVGDSGGWKSGGWALYLRTVAIAIEMLLRILGAMHLTDPPRST